MALGISAAAGGAGHPPSLTSDACRQFGAGHTTVVVPSSATALPSTWALVVHAGHLIATPDATEGAHEAHVP